MVSKKKVVAIAITTMALTVGSIGITNASTKSSVKVSMNKGMRLPDAQKDKLAGVLSDLVKKGTLTQAQVDALNAAIAAARTADDAKRVADKAAHEAERAALVWSLETAKLAREHNNANVISVGGRLHSIEDCQSFIDAFLATPFSGDERHIRRINQMSNFETTGEIK